MALHLRSSPRGTPVRANKVQGKAVAASPAVLQSNRDAIAGSTRWLVVDRVQIPTASGVVACPDPPRSSTGIPR
jgi:hypothetical protein